MTQIKEAINEDFESVLALAKKFPSPTELDEDHFKIAWIEKINDPNSYVGVALEKKSIVGYISGYLHSAFYANGSTFLVDEIFVVEDKRGSGVGRHLMESITHWTGERNCKLIALATNGAKDFYSALGFQDSARYFKKYL